MALARAMASSSVSKGAMWQQGPKISSRMMALVSGSPVQIVGCTQGIAGGGFLWLGLYASPGGNLQQKEAPPAKKETPPAKKEQKPQ